MNKKLVWIAVVAGIVALSVVPGANALPALCQATFEDPLRCLPLP